ncbi:hypothetical protein BDP81DRAFT_61955 [Colletotrichum phormii]|uniref:Uncharacterized protein n=1 Tax=Colletotrichum phormii TaxID=359342 RepID=A0AAJ0ECC1_9PEZI|nr:uncharacterized protein BDP81DRAFT_61955 [Colletotrichum phormii]KAK1633849.1 hypothetical protein BDP81DRAFT_61955 [Colletotrichum phormii]
MESFWPSQHFDILPAAPPARLKCHPPDAASFPSLPPSNHSSAEYQHKPGRSPTLHKSRGSRHHFQTWLDAVHSPQTDVIRKTHCLLN